MPVFLITFIYYLLQIAKMSDVANYAIALQIMSSDFMFTTWQSTAGAKQEAEHEKRRKTDEESMQVYCLFIIFQSLLENSFELN